MSEPDRGRRLRRVRGLGGGWVLAAALSLALAGCTAGPGEPTTLPTVIPSVSGTDASPTPAASAAVSDEEQIEAAVRAYFDAMNTGCRHG